MVLDPFQRFDEARFVRSVFEMRSERLCDVLPRFRMDLAMDALIAINIKLPLVIENEQQNAMLFIVVSY